MRSRQMRSAGMSPVKARSIAFWVNAGVWPSKSVSNARVTALRDPLAGRLGCRTHLPEMASPAVFPLYFQPTSDQHPIRSRI